MEAWSLSGCRGGKDYRFGPILPETGFEASGRFGTFVLLAPQLEEKYV
jgi:hypothetical protein